MTTNNIISTPEITGNIGSCKTELTEVRSFSGWFHTGGYNITTNSCNGETLKTDWSTLNVFPVFGITVLLCILLMIGAAFNDKDSLRF